MVYYVKLTAKLRAMNMISIILPTYNEKENIKELVHTLSNILSSNNLLGEIIIVDDNSPDGTGAVAEELKNNYPVRVIHRSGKLGLGSAVIEGFNIAKGEILGVMDSDISHDPYAIPDMIRPIVNGEADFTIGSRYIKGGGITNWPLTRRITSKSAILLAYPFVKVKDLTSGFFFLHKNVINNVALNPLGFKICLEIIFKGNYKKIKEIPYTFTNRKKGKSKFNAKEIILYICQLILLIKYKFYEK